MANSQLTAYASAQLDKGVSREAITQALVGAGWMQADVDAAVIEVIAQRATTATSPAAQAQPASTPAVNPVTTTVATTTSPATSTVTPASFFATTPSMTMEPATTAPKRSMTWLFVVVAIILALGIIGGVVYAFMGGKAVPAAITGADATALATTQQERDQFKAEVATLTQSQSVLENELSIFAATTTPITEITVAGKLTTTTTNTWILTTPHNIVITISNAKDATVAATLTPLKDADVSLTGTHAPTSPLLKVTGVNGAALTSAAATTTTSTPKAPAALPPTLPPVR